MTLNNHGTRDKIDEWRGLAMYLWQRSYFSNCKPGQTDLIKRNGSLEDYSCMKAILKAVFLLSMWLCFRTEFFVLHCYIYPLVCEKTKKINRWIKKGWQSESVNHYLQREFLKKNCFKKYMIPNIFPLFVQFKLRTKWYTDFLKELKIWKLNKTVVAQRTTKIYPLYSETIKRILNIMLKLF